MLFRHVYTNKHPAGDCSNVELARLEQNISPTTVDDGNARTLISPFGAICNAL